MIPTEKKYLSALTFPRFILALMVVVHHYGRNTFPFGSKEEGLTRYVKFVDFSNLAVGFFFFLSGFILIYNYWDRKVNVKEFYIRRISRLYPIYLLALVAIAVLALILQGIDFHGIKTFFLQAAGLQAWYPGKALTFNYPAWSLSVEFFFYAVFPLFLFFFRKIPFWLTSTIVLLIYSVGLYQYYYFCDFGWKEGAYAWNQFLVYFPLWHLNTFLMGILGGLIFLKIKSFKTDSYFWSILAIGSIFTFFFILGSENQLTRYSHNGALSPLFMLICLGLAKDERIFNKLFGWKPLVFLGEISYGLYLWQFVVYILYVRTFNLDFVYGKHFYLYLLLLIIGSSISYLYIEKPARNWINQRFIKR